ncbi:MAG: hypothetical protein QM602_12260 [Microbacterium sp.]
MHLATIVAAAAGAEEHHGNIMLDTIWYPIVALVAFAALALVTFSYRDVANRHSAKAEAYARTHTSTHSAGGETEGGH